MAEYYDHMKTLPDEMASVGKKLNDEELSSYMLDGLDIGFNLVVSAIAARVDPLSFDKLYTSLSASSNALIYYRAATPTLWRTSPPVVDAAMVAGVVATAAEAVVLVARDLA